MEQGLSYDAKAVYDIALKNGFDVYISYRTKRKIKWECNFIPENKLDTFLNEDDLLFCFEVFPQKHLVNITKLTAKLYLMINFEYVSSINLFENNNKKCPEYIVKKYDDELHKLY